MVKRGGFPTILHRRAAHADTPHHFPLSAPPAWLHDRLGRRVDHLRISVTDRCDLRCTYCMPQQFAGLRGYSPTG